MNFPFNCPSCGHENHAEWSQIGKQALCGWCGKAAMVPAPMETVGGEFEVGLAIRFECPACGRKFATKPTLGGQKVRCNGCGGGVRVPAAISAPAGSVPRVVLNARSGSGQSLARPPQPMTPAAVFSDKPESDSFPDELESLEERTRRLKAAVALPSRAETMEQVRQQEAEKEAVVTKTKAEKEKRAKKKKRKKSGDLDLQETLTLVGGVSVVVGALGLAAWYFPDFRYFLGGLVAVIGFILYFLGARSLRELAAHEGFFKLTLYRFCPPYQLWFVLTHWDEARDFFAFFVSGAIVMSIGGAVVTTSPTFKKAAASEREYQKAMREAVYGEFEHPRPVASPPAAKRAEDAAKK
jgi:transcription elongation factor Elf1